MSAKSNQRVIVWIRNELRVQDNLALWNACADANEVIPFYIIDNTFRSYSPAKQQVVLDGLRNMRQSLQRLGGELVIREGNAEQVLCEFISTTESDGIYYATSLEPYAKEQEDRLKSILEQQGKAWVGFQDHLLFDPSSVSTQSGTPYLVFTAFKNMCLSNLNKLSPLPPRLSSVQTPKLDYGVIPGDVVQLPKISKGGEYAAHSAMNEFLDRKVRRYQVQRDIPAEEGTSRLSHHLSCGSLSIKRLFHETQICLEQHQESGGNDIQTYRNELLWREFFYHVMWHYPHVVHSSFKKEFDRIEWSGNEAWFQAWCNGQTGYPMVDAAMRQLNSENWMHNRARMIVASFLTKDLHIYWRRGEEYFLSKLVDGDLALNNAGWQWSAGTGTDAQPWFRIFNPVLQGKKYDVSGNYVRRYIPELQNVPDQYIHEPWLMPPVLQRHLNICIGKSYPVPIVNHDEERKKTLELYGVVKGDRL